jgi:RNA polymerase sigma-70 factor, ECF subfamily
MSHLQVEDEPQQHDAMVDETSVDAKLFDAFRAGDHQAMRRIVELFHKRLIGFIRLYTRNRELAEEVAQEVFLAAYLQRNSVRRADGLRPWLFTVAKRKALHVSEKLARNSEVCDEEHDPIEFLIPVQAEQGENILSSQLGAHLQQAFKQIPERDREILILRYFGNLQVKEIAEVLSIPMGSVGVFLNRTLTRLRKILENQGIEPEDVLSRRI